ncbi:MAG: DNA gyrase subunit A, partial [Thermodesulfobacteriota bacterium]
MIENRGTKIPVYIEDEMRKSYMDYAMSVIVGRALPDVRDGLKPVHRRVLFAMHELGVEWNKPYKKSARIVGDVIGKYHPHGDVAVYDTMVRMVQDFSLRYPLIDGQGNFGSIDGDSPAAMRYTEVRMAKITKELLDDIEKETVNFSPNYDGSLKEPVVLPSKVPNLLINGSSGIAVGMATNIPPHNLSEVVDALIHLIEHPDAAIRDIMEFLPGPDFPTAGFIYGREGINEAYLTGRGIIHVRGRAIVEIHGRTGRESIVISEIPFQVNKTKLLEKIADLVKDRRIEGITEIRDESDRDGMRIVLELKRDENTQVILNKLFAHTQMQSSFGIIFLTIVDGQPKVLNIKKLLEHFVAFRKEIVTRRCTYELKKAKEKAHILEGLKIALDHLDEVIALIKKSKSPQEAREGLIDRFALSDIQARAILEMRLQRLTALERDKILKDYNDLLKLIAELEAILGDERLIMEVVTEELKSIKERFGDERRTEIVEKTTDLTIEDLIVEEEMVVTISHSGYIKRNPLTLFRIQRRGGKGKKGMTTKEEDFVEHLFVASTKSYILFFTDKGKVYWLKVHEIPQAGRVARGKAIVNILNLSPDENIQALLPVKEFSEDLYLVMATKKGWVKKTPLMAYSHPRAGGIIALTIEEGDELISVRITGGEDEVFVGTREGKAIKFREDQVRKTGRTSRGVKGITLREGDEVVGMETLKEGLSILTVTEKGFG